MSTDLGDVAEDGLVNAKIIPVMPPGIPVVFSFNPSTITMTRTAFTDSKGASGAAGATPSVFMKSTPRTLQMEGFLEGPQTHTMAQALLEMMSPSGGLLGSILALAGITKAKLPTLLFEWGPFTMPCTMKTCSAVYSRFHASGLPLRAKCNLTVQELISPLSMLMTNPTSGGLPGREQHVMISGDNLPQLATKSYGHPGRWREIAEANGVDNPFVIKPGEVMYVPSPAELAKGR